MIIRLIEKNHTQKKLIYDISYKSLIGAKPLLIRFDEIDLLELMEFMMELDISIIWSRNMLFALELNVLKVKKVASHTFVLTIKQR